MLRGGRLALAATLAVMLTAAAGTASLAQQPPAGWGDRPGWRVMATPHGFDELVARLDRAVADAGMFLVTRASASQGATNQGLAIPGNMVVGVFRNDFARRMLAASVPAGIEAPIRFYLTENADGTATLGYRTPSHVFAPYMGEGGGGLRAVAEELDGLFALIAEQAAGG